MKKPIFQSICLYTIYKGVLSFYLKTIVGVEFGNSNFLKKEDQFIILANHNSHLDTLSLMSSLPGEILWKVKPVAAEDYFGSTKLKARFSNFFINTLLIRRKKSQNTEELENPIKKMLNAIDEGYSLILFPEGTRGDGNTMETFKPGIAHLLTERPHLKYVPVFLTGMDRTLPKGEFLVLPYKSTVNFGEPTLPISKNRTEIIDQIAADFLSLKEKYQPAENTND